MNQIIKTKIDGIAIEIEIANATPQENQPIVQPAKQQVVSVKIGDSENPVCASDVAKIQKALADNTDVATLIIEIAKAIQDTPTGKDFWLSKVFWLNVLTVIGTIALYFGFDFKAHNLNPELIATLITTILGAINVYLRGGTNAPINPLSKSLKRILPS